MFNPLAEEDKPEEQHSFSFYSDPLAGFAPSGLRSAGRGGSKGGGNVTQHGGRGAPPPVLQQQQYDAPPQAGIFNHPSGLHHQGHPQSHQQPPSGPGAMPFAGRAPRGPRPPPGPPPPMQPPMQQQWPSQHQQQQQQQPTWQQQQRWPQQQQQQQGHQQQQQAKFQRTGPDSRRPVQHHDNNGGQRNGGMARFYKPSFSQDPWQPLLQAAAQRSTPQVSGPGAGAQASSKPAGSGQQQASGQGLGFAVDTSRLQGGSSLADLMESGMEEALRTGEEAVADRPWH